MSKIPKQIHYFWFGKNQKSDLIQHCIESWKENLPDYEIMEWNESNYDVYTNRFTRKAYDEEKWAFLSDYARLDVLNQYGGIYLDTDMEVRQPLDAFLQYSVFIGMESETHANGSIIGSVPRHWYLEEVLHEYSTLQQFETIPSIMTRVLSKYCAISNIQQNCSGVEIFPAEYFYPFPFGAHFSEKYLTPNTHTIHWWDYSWGSKRARILKKFGLLKPTIWLRAKLR